MWAVWGNVSPSSLRFCIRSITTARDGVCGLWVKDGKPYEWRSER